MKYYDKMLNYPYNGYKYNAHVEPSWVGLR